MTSQICSAAAIAAGFKLPYAGFPCTATVAQSLRPFPMYSVSLGPQFANQGNSYYDSLQVKFTKRLSHGLDITSAYTFSKTLNIGGYINGNPYNRVIQKGLDRQTTIRISWSLPSPTVTPKATNNATCAPCGRLDLVGRPALCQRQPDLRRPHRSSASGTPTRSHPARR